MDRNVLHQLARPHRLGVAFVIALVLGGGAGGLVGVARATDDNVVAVLLPPPPFALPTPFEGDRGRYELDAATLDAETAARGFATERALDISFKVLPSQAQFDADGQEHWTRQVHVQSFERQDERNRSEDLVVGTTQDGRVISAVGIDATDDEHGYRPGVLGLPGGNETSRTTWRTVSFGGQTTLPCGILNDYQGQEIVYDSLHHVRTMCHWGPSDVDPNLHWAHVRGLNETGYLQVDFYVTHPDDRPAIEDGRTQPWWTAMFHPDVPYPVEMRNIHGYFGAPGDVLRLVGFERGDKPLTDADRPLETLPRVEDATRPVWMLDDSGVDHPFPLSAAYQYALTDPATPGLRDFMAQHPTAYVVWARHAEFDVDGDHSHRWSFGVSDGTAIHQVVLSRHETAGASALPDVRSPLPAVSYSYETADHVPPGGDQVWLPVERAPALTPRVSSLLATWQKVLPAGANPDATSSWSFQFGCFDPCDQSALIVHAGQVYYYRESEPGYPLVDEHIQVWDTSQLTWGNGQLLAGTESEQVHTTTQDPDPAPMSASDPPVPVVELRSTPGASWVAPTPQQAVGIGLGAIGAALLYWLWPLAKGGGLGLFSRVHKDRLLDNPLRTQLVQRIEAEPGIHHNALVRDLGKGKGAAEHHLDKLVAARLVLRHRSPGYTCYFPTGTDHRSMAASPATKADGARRILEALQRGASGVREVAASTGLAPSTVSHHLERLRAAGLVTGNGQTGYHAVPGASSTGQAAA